jgi:hypothetical protein
MLRRIAMIGLGALFALAPLPALAQTNPPAAPGATSASQSHATAATRSGSYRSQMRHRNNQARERARATAEHARKVRHGS